VIKPSSTVCRPVNGVCDVAENCDGTNAACPTDKFDGTSTKCYSATGLCDQDTYCTGSSGACTHASLIDDRVMTCVCARVGPNYFKSSSTLCRAAVGVCDANDVSAGVASARDRDRAARTQYCAGNSATCNDAKLPTSTVCRTAMDLCEAVCVTDGCVLWCSSGTDVRTLRTPIVME
jgi:hypothetical protein